MCRPTITAAEAGADAGSLVLNAKSTLVEVGQMVAQRVTQAPELGGALVRDAEAKGLARLEIQRQDLSKWRFMQNAGT